MMDVPSWMRDGMQYEWTTTRSRQKGECEEMQSKSAVPWDPFSFVEPCMREHIVYNIYHISHFGIKSIAQHTTRNTGRG